MKRLQHSSVQINAVTVAGACCSQFRPHPPRLFPLLQGLQALAPYREWRLYLSHVSLQRALQPARNTTPTFHQPSKIQQVERHQRCPSALCSRPAKLPNPSQMRVLPLTLPAKMLCASSASPSPLAMLSYSPQSYYRAASGGRSFQPLHKQNPITTEILIPAFIYRNYYYKGP